MDINKIQRYSLHRLIIVISLLFFLVIIINSISKDIGNTYKDDYANRIEINVGSNSIDHGNLISTGDIEDMARIFPNGNISYMNQKDTAIEANNAVFPIKAVLSGENLEKFEGLNMLRGCFFSSEQYQYGNKVAVVSDTMAFKLFGTHNIIGNEIYISDTKYRITGIYKSRKSILSVLASDGVERVYIPFNSMPGSSSELLNTIFIKDAGLKEEVFRVHATEEKLKEQLKTDTGLYRINDFYDSSIYASQPLSVFIFLVGVLLICQLIKYLIIYLKFGTAKFKAALNNNYFIGILIKWKLRIPLFVIGVMLILFFAVTVFRTVSFRGIVPARYIPADNIFDFGFYAEKIRDAIYSGNNYTGYVPTQLEALYGSELQLIYISMLFLLLNFIASLSAIKLNKLVSESVAEQMTALAVSILIGLAMPFGLCLVCGIKYIIPVKEMMILIMYLTIKSVNEKGLRVYVSKNLIENEYYFTSR